MNTRSITNIEKGFEEAGFTVTNKAWLDANDEHYKKMQEAYQEWLEEEGKRRNVPPFLVSFDYPFSEPAPYTISKEEVAGCKAKIAVYVISRNSGEGKDREYREGDYLFYPEELDGIRNLIAGGKK